MGPATSDDMIAFSSFRAGFQQGAAAMLTFGRMGATAQISKKSGKQKCIHFTCTIFHITHYNSLPT